MQSIAEPLNADKEPATSSNAERRSSFKLPAPLSMGDDIVDRIVWSPNRRNASIVGNGELWSSNSPRTTQAALHSHVSGSSGLSSPKPVTPTKFEDPLLSMPSFRRSGGSPILLDPAGAGAGAAGVVASPPPLPLALSPSFRAPCSNSSNSFAARRSHIDFRRSVPGATNLVSHNELAAVTAVRPSSARHPSLSLTRGNSDFGNLDLTGYASSFVGSESGGPGLDDDEATTDTEGDTVTAAGPPLGLSPRVAALATVSSSSGGGGASSGGGSGHGPVMRRHSAFVVHSPSSRTGYISPAARLGPRPAEDEELLSRLQQNRTSWRERPRAGSYGPCGLSFGGCTAHSEGLQNQTHAALQQLRGELKSLSIRSMHGATGALSSVVSTNAAVGGSGGGGGGGTAAAASTGPGGHVTSSADSSSIGGSGSGGVGELPAIGRFSEGQAQLSPSRLSIIRHHYSISGGGGGDGGGGGRGDAPPELFPPWQATIQASYNDAVGRIMQQHSATAAAANVAMREEAEAEGNAPFCAEANL